MCMSWKSSTVCVSKVYLEPNLPVPPTSLAGLAARRADALKARAEEEREGVARGATAHRASWRRSSDEAMAQVEDEGKGELLEERNDGDWLGRCSAEYLRVRTERRRTVSHGNGLGLLPTTRCCGHLRVHSCFCYAFRFYRRYMRGMIKTHARNGKVGGFTIYVNSKTSAHWNNHADGDMDSAHRQRAARTTRFLAPADANTK
jgi:hypothetical protein